ncbi:MAG: FAD-dependent oxidoreductase, partial [Acetobacteraceae bacterium]|nr:FAD-dependent oxidoreductase [Acetobacteraceae bacterium]
VTSLPSRVDAVVIGGGIQGLTFAGEAGRRGQRVLLLEAGEWGGGSTAASLGIIHGGFRYWQNGDVGRVVRSRREQAWFLRQFPAAVRPLRCLMPFYRGDPAKPALFAAAAAADRGVRSAMGSRTARLPPPRLIGRRTLLALAPWLEEQPVLGAGEWHDVELVDRPGLIDALLAHAAEWDATCLDGAEVRQVRVSAGGEVAGVEGVRCPSGATFRIETPVVVNCGGLALETLARSADPLAPSFFKPLRAHNLQLRHEAPLPAAFAVGTGKRLFLRPVPEGLVAGTFYGESVEIEHWMDELDRAAPGLDLRRTSSVAGTLSGVVPAGRDGATPERRDTVLDHGASGGPRGLFSISGVKLTTARWLSAQAAGRIWPAGIRQHARPCELAGVPA